MLNLSKLAKVPLTRLHELPASAGVYLAIDDADRVWYVGQSMNLRERLSRHNHLDDFEDNEVNWIVYQPDDNPKALEPDLIAYYNPPLNRGSNALPLANIDGMNEQQCFERYCQIKEMIKNLEAEAEALKPNVFTFVQGNGEDGKRLRYDGYNVTNQTRKIWEYSPAVNRLAEDLKKLKAKEQKEGTARVIGNQAYPVVKIVAPTIM